MVKNILLVILLIISSVSLFLNTKFYKTLQLENKVVEVVDGDTFQLKSGKCVVHL